MQSSVDERVHGLWLGAKRFTIGRVTTAEPLLCLAALLQVLSSACHVTLGLTARRAVRSDGDLLNAMLSLAEIIEIDG